MKSLIKNKRSIIYSIILGLGLSFSLQMLVDYGENAFWIAIGISSLIMIFTIYMNWRYASKVIRQLDMPKINVYDLKGNLVNHIFLPFMLFYSVAGFIFYNNDSLIRGLTVILFVFVNYILFMNIEAYYKDEFRKDEKTRYIYDTIKLIISFIGTNLILHFSRNNELEIYIQAILIYILLCLLGSLAVTRRNMFSFKPLTYVGITSFVIALFFMLALSIHIVMLGVNLLTFLLFYFSLSILHHRAERTLTLSVFGEYVVIFLLGFVLFLGIS